MTNSQKTYWLRLYECAQQISSFSPWEYFSEECRFLFFTKDDKTPVFFSFIGPSLGKRGIACYIGEKNYLAARKNLTKKNSKKEPLFYLQDGFVCIWDDRDRLEKESYNQIKDLGLQFRGKGCWLHFERYETGYYPSLLTDKEVIFLTEMLENLFMMLRAIYERKLDPHFEDGHTLVRWYEPKDELYYTHDFKMDISENILDTPLITVEENAKLKEFRHMPASNFSVQVDWSYVGVVYPDDDGRETIPRMLLGVAQESEFILINEMLSPKMNKYNVIFNLTAQMIQQTGKPREIIVCEKELENILSDFCKKSNIQLKLKKNLPELKRARESLLHEF